MPLQSLCSEGFPLHPNIGDKIELDLDLDSRVLVSVQRAKTKVFRRD